jgi:hypothetical protein
MKIPHLQIAAHTTRLDAGPQSSVFYYSTLGRPFGGKKAQAAANAGSTGALDGYGSS